jgi:hypothetical protein
MPIAIGLGYIGGVVLSYFCGQWIIFRIGDGITFRELKRSLVAILGIVGGITALLPALFLGTVIGGNLGGAYGEAVSASTGFGMAGVPVALAFGICIVTMVVTSGGVLVGAMIGKVLSAAISKSAT